jgi:hypothetical protein
MIAFISENIYKIVIGAVVNGIIVFALVRTILNIRGGGSPCGCGCKGCSKAAVK